MGDWNDMLVYFYVSLLRLIDEDVNTDNLGNRSSFNTRKAFSIIGIGIP